jgi:hypothetical protein
MLSDRELMTNHVNALFKHDAENKMTVVNEPPFYAAPLIFIGGTKEGSIVRYSSTLDADNRERMEQIIKTSPANLAEIINALSTGYELTNISFGPAYAFPDVRDRSSKAIRITNENKELLKPDFPYTFEEFDYKQPCFVIVEDDIVVSICCSARQTPEADEASVYTHKDYRGRSYAAEVANAWAVEVQRQGRIALYSTSWDNVASQSIARKLQLVQYGTDIHMS